MERAETESDLLPSFGNDGTARQVEYDFSPDKYEISDEEVADSKRLCRL